MRMFLVGMCDIFLILYLTTIGHVRPEDLSSLTVNDYYSLKISEEALKKLLQQQKEAAEREQSKLQKAYQKLASEKELSSQQQLQKAEDKIKNHQELLAKLKEQQQTAERQLQNLQRSSENQLKEKEKLIVEIKNEKEALKKDQRKAEEASKAAIARLEEEARKEEALKLKLEKELQAARGLAEKARLEAEEAVSEKNLAHQEKQRALKLAKLAQSEKQEAVKIAEKAAKVAELSRIMVSHAKERVEETGKIASESTEKLNLVTIPADAAYQRNIKDKLVTVQVNFEQRNLLFGDTEKSFRLRGLPVNWQGRQYIFFPLNHLGLSQGAEALNKIRRYRVSISNQSVHSMLLSPQEPFIAALEVPQQALNRSGAPILGQSQLRLLMPTLIAVRNNAKLEYDDRIRNLNPEYLVFKRDNLEQETGRLFRYAARGMRGTYDYAEKVISGDQIVDLEGNFIGVVSNDNTVLVVHSLGDWNAVNLNGNLAQELSSETGGRAG